MTADDSAADAIVIGGGPAGSVSAALLASRGYDVRLIAQPPDGQHDLANSLPPSTRKLLAATNILPIVDRVGLKSRGNTVWWGAGAPRVESFDPSGRVFGYQVLRSVLDPLLLEHAERSRARVVHGSVTKVDLLDDSTLVTFRSDGGRKTTVRARLVLDASGRTGIVARQGFRHPRPDFRMQALLGSWDGASAAEADDTHTIVETYADGWAWSIPISPLTRHVGVMVDGALSGVLRARTLAATYRGELAKAPHMTGQVAGATLQRVWACDASVYSAREFARRGVLLVGDAGAAIDPLSSFGFKKALASAWLAAIVAHTCLAHPDREAVALQFFNDWERRVYRTHTRRSREFAREALARYPSAFWESRAVSAGPDESASEPAAQIVEQPEVAAAVARIRDGAGRLTRNPRTPFVLKPEVRDGEIVMLEAVACPDGSVLRYFQNVDLVELAAYAPRYESVSDLFDALGAARRLSPPAILASLSLLVAARILRAETDTA